MDCVKCGQEAPSGHSYCLDCIDQMIENERQGNFDHCIEDTPSLCNCEDRPCCGCGG